MTYRRGFNRLFVVFAICWYIAAGFMLWPKWQRALSAHRYAEFIRTNSPSPDGSHLVYEDEITTGTEAPRPSNPKLTMSPMRFLAWDSAEREAKALRPTGDSVLYATLPVVIYLMAVALGWIARGFKAKSSRTQI